MGKYNRKGRKRGKRRGMALFGGGLLLLAAVGLVWIVSSGVRGVTNMVSDDSLRLELDAFLEPVVLVDPDPFDSPDKIPNNIILESAVWAALFKNNEEGIIYTMDDDDRLMVPEADVTAQAARLFAPGYQLKMESFGAGDTVIEYDAPTKSFFIPGRGLNGFTPHVTEIKEEKSFFFFSKKGAVTTATVGYLSAGDFWTQDKTGNTVQPDPSKYYLYELEGKRGAYLIRAVKELPQEE